MAGGVVQGAKDPILKGIPTDSRALRPEASSLKTLKQAQLPGRDELAKALKRQTEEGRGCGLSPDCDPIPDRRGLGGPALRELGRE